MARSDHIPPDATVNIVWFKRDLRLADHPALCAAVQAEGPVLPLFIVEPGYWRQPDVSGRHYAFLAECLDDLAADCRRAGAPLIVRTGDAVAVLEALRMRFGRIALFSHEETGNGWTYARDRAVGEWARAQGVNWTELPQSGVIRRLASRNGWAARWDRWMAQPCLDVPPLDPVSGLEPDPLPDAGALGLADDPCPGRQIGGRAEGLSMLDSFLTQRGEPYRTAMSAPGPGAEHCSRLSPHIAWGTLSLREVAQEGWTRQAEARRRTEAKWSASMRSFMSRLHWRDHFIQKLEDEPRIEHEDMHPGLEGLRPQSADPERLKAWATGQTGIPFVDACMRSLVATGWLNFRMRAMLMSFASYHLWLPWQESGLHLARCFTDYEPGIHWPQVQMQSGTTGVNAVRVYNPVKQGCDQDPDGAFTRRWLPELGEVPDTYLQEPWRWSGAGRVLGSVYPEPVVDLAAASRAARERIFERRRSAGFKHGSAAVLARHGSRAPSPRKRRQRRSGGSGSAAQFQLDL